MQYACPTRLRCIIGTSWVKSYNTLHKKQRAKEIGSTLVELLVVIGIIVAIAALLFPAFTQAKIRAFEATENSNLRQLGIAHSLYVADNDDRTPGSSMIVIGAKYAPPIVAASPLDPFRLGWANENRSPGQGTTLYKDSFIALADCAGDMFFEEFRASQNGGWLISAGVQLARYGVGVELKPVPYKRLTFSGGLIKRVFPVGPAGDIFMDRCFSDDKVIPDTPLAHP